MEFIKGKGEVKAEIVVNGAKKFEEYGFEGKDGEVLVLPDKKRVYVGIEEINSENLKIATIAIIAKANIFCLKHILHLMKNWNDPKNLDTFLRAD
jgi:hypothetical protein